MPQKREDGADVALPDIADVLDETEAIIRQCFKEYQLHEVFLSFNGGKDCTVLLDITIKILQDVYNNRENIAKDLKVVYIRSQGPFKEIEEFVKYIEKYYNIKLVVFEGEMKNNLEALIEEDGRLKASLMGTRRTDPYSGHLDIMTKTDSSWPQLMRVFPLLNWSYHQIWSYLLKYKVPYCSLYDKGYTSIGSVQNTWPNPSLAYKDCCGCLSYHPAWCLADAALERAGRGKQTNGHKGTTPGDDV
ncbi:FAD synthase isoform X2 [Plodia interpunctella]|nr:FAD synthase isoform X2 [Plodia interpunctella]XP_053602351.1 FAD synthase isoform X2 [Plodia interpunctella]